MYFPKHVETEGSARKRAEEGEEQEESKTKHASHIERSRATLTL